MMVKKWLIKLSSSRITFELSRYRTISVGEPVLVSSKNKEQLINFFKTVDLSTDLACLLIEHAVRILHKIESRPVLTARFSLKSEKEDGTHLILFDDALDVVVQLLKSNYDAAFSHGYRSSSVQMVKF
jgi:hypothetical protein